MNQILMTGNSNVKKNKEKKINANRGPVDTKSIARTFAIIIIIFGIMLSGSGSYALIKDINSKNSKNIPTVTTEQNGNAIKLTVKNDVGIKYVQYSWNDSAQKTVQGNNKKEVDSVINIIAGDNKLNITVIDANNAKTQYVKNYVQKDKDTTEPVITVSNEDPKIKITVTDDTALDHVVYKYGDNNEVTVNANPDDPTKLEIYLDNVETTQKTLKIEAVDKAQNVATAEQQVKGVTKAKIEVTPDPSDASYLIIKVNDNDGIRMVSFYLNGQEFQTDPNTSLNTKEFTYRCKVNKGQTNVTVHAYNVSEQVTEFQGVYNY